VRQFAAGRRPAKLCPIRRDFVQPHRRGGGTRDAKRQMEGRPRNSEKKNSDVERLEQPEKKATGVRVGRKTFRADGLEKKQKKALTEQE